VDDAVVRAGEPGDRPDAHEDVSEVGSSLQALMNEIGRFPLLSAREEVELAKRIERGDREARDRMINSNLRLVVSIAKRYRAPDLPLVDLVQEGILGLIRAVDKFDWRLGYKFSTYATWWIRQAVQRGVANKSGTIRLPVHVGELARRIARAEDRLATRLGRLPENAEIAVELGLSEAQVRRARQAPRAVVSLDRRVEEEGPDLYELVAAPDAPTFDEIELPPDGEALRRAVAQLPARERDVVRLRYGLDGEPLNAVQVGELLGITRQRVKQLEVRALARLALEPEVQELHAA
jgi:RNA polymerase primary sigma factor